MIAHGFEQFELAAGRHAGGGKVGAVEIAVDALILPEENLLVHFLEIERVIEGKPHPRVLEFRAPNIEGESLHQAEISDGKFLEQDALVGDRREVVGGGPVLGEVLDAPVDRIRLEGFERDGGVAEIFEVQLVEIVAADIDVDVAAPIVLDALVDDVAAGREILDAVGPGAERRLERGVGDVAFLAVGVGALPPVLRQDGQLADDLRQFVIAGAVEGEGDFVIAGLLRFGDVAVIGGRLRAVLLVGFEGEDDVVRRHRRAVMPFRLRPQPIADRGKIVRIAQRLGNQSVFARYFVERGHRERVVDQIDAGGERAFDAGNHRVEIVERAVSDLPRGAGLRRRGVDVIELLEVRLDI